MSCTINTESVLNLRTTKTDRVSRSLLHLCHVRTTCDERCSVQCTCCTWVTTAIRLACSVSNTTRLLWSEHVNMVSALYHTLTSSFCRVTFYGLSLSTRQNKNELTMLSARAHLLNGCYIWRLLTCRLFLHIRTGNPWQNPSWCITDDGQQ